MCTVPGNYIRVSIFIKHTPNQTNLTNDTSSPRWPRHAPEAIGPGAIDHDLSDADVRDQGDAVDAS